MAVPECPIKAAEFDKQHWKLSTSRTNVKNHAGARELAGQYTGGWSVCICPYVTLLYGQGLERGAHTA